MKMKMLMLTQIVVSNTIKEKLSSNEKYEVILVSLYSHRRFDIGYVCI